jgi:hypothetical protein
MHRFPLWLGVLLAMVLGSTEPVSGQMPHFGIMVGPSLVGGSDSCTLVGPGVSGADRAGLHLRAFALYNTPGSSFMPLSVGLAF